MKPFICKRCGKETFSLVSGEYTNGTEWYLVCSDCYAELGYKKPDPPFHFTMPGGSKWPIEDVAKTMRISKEEAQHRRDTDPDRGI